MYKMLVVAVVSILFGTISGGLTATYLLRHRLDSLTVGQLVITDESGITRASLGTDPSSQVSLNLFGPNKTRQLLLGVVKRPYQVNGITYEYGDTAQPWAPLIELDDAGGRTASMLSTADEGNSIFNFYGTNQSSQLSIGYVGDGSDVVGPGIKRGAWGLRARRGFHEAGVGVLDYDTAGNCDQLVPCSPTRSKH